MKDYRTAARRCPHCGYMLNGAANATGERAPRNGDISICIMCAGIATFEGSRFVVMSDVTFKRLDTETKRQLQEWIDRVKRIRS